MTASTARRSTLIRWASGAAVGLTLLAMALGGRVTSRAVLADIKMVIMTSVYADTEGGQTQLAAEFQRVNRRDPSGTDYRPYLDPGVLRSATSAVPANDVAALMRYLVRAMSPDQPLRGCGDIASLRELVAAASRDHGCCSDFSKVLIAYGLALSVPVRETHNLEHTTVEYFDRHAGRWIWIDPTLRTQAFDRDGGALGQTEIRSLLLQNQKVEFRDLSGRERPDLEARAVYSAAAYRIVSWSAGGNLVEQDQVDAVLRRLRLGKPLRQFIEYLARVNPGYIGLASESTARNFAWLRGATWVGLSAVGLLDVIAAGLVLRWLASTIASRIARKRLSEPVQRRPRPDAKADCVTQEPGT